MQKSRSTKHALLCSVLATVLCAAMLVGTTFAWFTDSVTSGKNRIVAGNLDVELEYMDESGEWQPVTEDTEDLFLPSEGEGATLWEPGHTEYVQLRIRNAGSLAFQYDFRLNVYGKSGGEETTFTNANGEEVKLSDFLVFNKIDGINVGEDRENYWIKDADAEKAAMGTKALAAVGETDTVLLPGDAPKEFTLAVYMPTWVGNEANHRDAIDLGSIHIANDPYIQLDFTLLATQTPYESDSFDNQYDTPDKYHYFAPDDTTLAALIDEACNPENAAYAGGDQEITIQLASNTTYTDPFTVKQYPQWNGLLGADTNIDIKDVDSSDQLKIKFVGGEGTVIGGGMTVSGYGQNLGGDPSTYSEYVATEFENVTFAGPSTLLDLNAGATHVTFTNCTFAGGSYIVVGGARFDTVHDIRFIGCTFEDAGVISGYWSSMQMENCNGTMGGGGFINIQGGTETTVKNCNISCSAGSLKYVIRTNSAAKLHFENSTIEVTGASELLYLRGGDTEISFDGCTLRYQADDLVRDGSNAGAKVWIDGQQVYPTAP